MKVTIFGTGYVGLVQAAVLAEVGHQICCIDVDEGRIAALRQGQIPFYEPGLAPLVESHLPVVVCTSLPTPPSESSTPTCCSSQ